MYETKLMRFVSATEWLPIRPIEQEELPYKIELHLGRLFHILLHRYIFTLYTRALTVFTQDNNKNFLLQHPYLCERKKVAHFLFLSQSKFQAPLSAVKSTTNSYYSFFFVLFSLHLNVSLVSTVFPSFSLIFWRRRFFFSIHYFGLQSGNQRFAARRGKVLYSFNIGEKLLKLKGTC